MTVENLWTSILSEVRQNATCKLPANKTLLVLGDNGSGKTTIVAKLQGVENPKKGSGLEYAYIDVRDEYRDDHTRLGAWILDGDPSLSFLLKFALSENTYNDTTIMLVVSMTTPWAILDQLRSWATILQDHIDKLNIDNEVLEQYKIKCIKKWNEYFEQSEEAENELTMKRSVRSLEDTEQLLNLPEGVLTRNLGLDVVVVVTKTDYMSTLEKDHDYREEHFDFIQQWIRKFCLQYGAALFYISAKEDKNCDLLYKYLTHRIYGLPFQAPALIVEKDAVFIPSGWDNMKKISILYENLQTMKPDDYYRDVILTPAFTRKAVARDIELHAEDEQSFLCKQFELLQQNTANVTIALPKQEFSQLRMSPGMQKTGDRRISTSPLQSQIAASKKIDASKVAAGNPGEGVLANFFNSLLHKKVGTPKYPSDTSGFPSNSGASSLRTDAAAELDKLANRRSGSFTNNNSLLSPSASSTPINANTPTTDATSDS